MPALPIVKADAYGNDFLLLAKEHASADIRGLVKLLCDRQRGLGADGLILYSFNKQTVSMTLFNADGSSSELSGNGLRCLAAFVLRGKLLEGNESESVVTVVTDAGTKNLKLLKKEGNKYYFRASLGLPKNVRQVEISVSNRSVLATVLSVGNPQCVVLGPLPNKETFNTLAPALSTHQEFPAGTNVEFAEVENPGRVRILIWERGVGVTSSSGTGASASAVAAALYGGAKRTVDVVAPGGTQNVEWRDDGIYLSGWAEVTFEGSYEI